MSPPKVNNPSPPATPPEEPVDLSSVVDDLLARIEQTTTQLSETMDSDEPTEERPPDEAPSPASNPSAIPTPPLSTSTTLQTPPAATEPADANPPTLPPEGAVDRAQDLGASLDTLLDDIQTAADNVVAAATEPPHQTQPPAAVPENPALAEAGPPGSDSPIDLAPSTSEEPTLTAAHEKPPTEPIAADESSPAPTATSSSPASEAVAVAITTSPPPASAPAAGESIESLDEQLAKLTDDLLADTTGTAPTIPPPEPPPPAPTPAPSAAAPQQPKPDPAPVSTSPKPAAAPTAAIEPNAASSTPTIEPRPPVSARISALLAPASDKVASILASPIASRLPEERKAFKLISGWTTLVAVIFWGVVLLRPREPDTAHANFDLAHDELPEVPNSPDAHADAAQPDAHGAPGGHGEPKQDAGHGGGHGGAEAKKVEKRKAPKPPTRSPAKKKEPKKDAGHGGGH